MQGYHFHRPCKFWSRRLVVAMETRDGALPSSRIPALHSLLNMSANIHASSFCPLPFRTPKDKCKPPLIVEAVSDPPGDIFISLGVLLDETQRGKEHTIWGFGGGLPCRTLASGLWDLKAPLLQRGVMAINVPCGAHVSAYAQVVRSGF